jgi:hypothetical protein
MTPETVVQEMNLAILSRKELSSLFKDEHIVLVQIKGSL